jgi:hypothetical protein
MEDSKGADTHGNQHNTTTPCNGEWYANEHPSTQLLLLLLMISLQLSKEDEAAAGGDEIEVRREDQDKINKFSRLHQKEIALEDELKTKHVSATSLDLPSSCEPC